MGKRRPTLHQHSHARRLQDLLARGSRFDAALHVQVDARATAVRQANAQSDQLLFAYRQGPFLHDRLVEGAEVPYQVWRLLLHLLSISLPRLEEGAYFARHVGSPVSDNAGRTTDNQGEFLGQGLTSRKAHSPRVTHLSSWALPCRTLADRSSPSPRASPASSACGPAAPFGCKRSPTLRRLRGPR